jgi:hypothetical protein
MIDKNIQLTKVTIDAINLCSTFSDTLYLAGNEIYFFEDHIRGKIELKQQLLSKPSKIPLKGFVQLIKKFKNPTITVNKNKLEVKEYRKNSTTEVLHADWYEVDEDEISSVELRKQNKFKYGCELPEYISLDCEDIDYQVVLDRDEIEHIKRLIDMSIQPKGNFVNGNPTKTKIFFTKEGRDRIVRVEDRNHGIFSYEFPVKPEESLKRNYQYVLSYKLLRLIPDGDFRIQMSGSKHVSEWFSHKRNLILSIDLLKISYAKN